MYGSNVNDNIDANLQSGDPLINLKYDVFNRHCHTPVIKPGNRINAQLKCEQFNGLHVKWEGDVINIEISEVYNFRSKVLSFLPTFLATSITCWFGEPNELMYDVYESDELDYLKSVFKERNKCNVNHWNTYEFRIGIKMDYSPAPIYLRAHHSFTNFTKFVQRSDRVWFKGELLLTPTNSDSDIEPKFIYDLDKYPLMLDLTAIGCVNCQNPELKTVVASSKLLLSNQSLYNGFKYLLNVLFNPLIKIN